MQSVPRLEGMAAGRQDSRAQIDERIDVRADCPSSREIAAGHPQDGAAGTREQRSKQQNRSAQPANQLTRRLRCLDVLATHAYRCGSETMHVGADLVE